ncbi:hypothetical protein EI555_000983 [Monodon monoceros]|uniref:LIM zinc-binding domain-containing protein n=1 Tax=Monodon monoceros TaxID=40151 RepID=A0A4U1ECM4_MONMO|nr:hypothetical protein EI555_000983 [Monodon monoceros]
MNCRAKSEAPAISSAIDRGDTETTMPSIRSDRAALCASCKVNISDRYYLLVVDKQWHMRCLKCCECKLNLELELTCFSKDGSTYCKEDYYRRFSVQRCARCHLGISASDMVMRARDLVYHLNCFTCTTCNKMLTTGDHFRTKDRLVYRRLHFGALLQGEYPVHFNHANVAKSAGLGAAGANPLGLPYYNSVGMVQKGRPRKRKSLGPGANPATYNAALSWNKNDVEHLDRDQRYPSSRKTKCMRNSFKHQQLRNVKSLPLTTTLMPRTRSSSRKRRASPSGSSRSRLRTPRPSSGATSYGGKTRAWTSRQRQRCRRGRHRGRPRSCPRPRSATPGCPPTSQT